MLPRLDRFARLSCQARQQKEGQADASSCKKERDDCGGCSTHCNAPCWVEISLWVLNNGWKTLGGRGGTGGRGGGGGGAGERRG
jgi:hypothetical protein